LPVDVHVDSVTVSENLAEVNGSTVNVGLGTAGAGTQRVAVSSDSSIAVNSLPSIPAGSNAIGSVSVSNFPSTQSVTGTGSAGSPAAGIITVQGNASGTPIPITGSLTASNPSVSTTGTAVPGSATLVGGTDGTNLRGLSVTTSGQLNVNNISGTVSLPTGAATSANQTNGSAKSQIVDGSGNVISSYNNQLLTTQLDVVATGTITSTQSVSIALNNNGTVGVQISGTWSGSIVTEGSDDGTNWYAVPGVALTSGNVASAFSVNNLIQVNVAGFNNFRVRGNTVASGTANINLHANAAVGGVVISNALVSGTNIIGRVGIDQTTPGTTNGVQINAALPAGSNSIGTVVATQSTASSLNATIVGSTAAGSGASSGLVTVQGNASGTPVPISGSISNTSFAVTQSTASSLNATIVGTTAAGSGASSGLITIQGNASGTPVPITGSITATNPSVGTTGSTAPTSATEIGGVYNSSLPTLTSGQMGAAQLDASSRLLVAQPTASALNATVSIAAAQTLATVTSVGSITNALPAGTNNIGLVGTGGSTGNANAPVYNVYSSTSITTSAYTQLIASTTSATNKVTIFDSSGQAMILATGGAGSEVILAYIPPGGAEIPVQIPASTRIAYKALTANATTGYLLINLWK
jgi:hypothetical protein